MINVNSEGITIESEFSNKTADLLWDMLNVAGARFVFLTPDFAEEISYPSNHKVVEHNKKKIGLFGVNTRDDFNSVIKAFGDACIDDFYITINSSFGNVSSFCDNAELFDEDGFSMQDYLLEFPLTIHVEEDRIFVDFKLFKASKFQLENLAKRYEVKMRK